MTDASRALQEQVIAAYEQRRAVWITGGSSKVAWCGESTLPRLLTAAHRGIVNYEPTELVVTARAGTALDELEQTLLNERQMLPFEPPHFGPGATLGGAVAFGASGPRRPFAGALRDAVLGVTMINGKGEVLRFGGEVMKNVAGYDLSRLQVGARGALGVILDVSLKVLPVPRATATLTQTLDAAAALRKVIEWQQQPWPLSATCFVGGQLYVRLEGSELAVGEAAALLGGDAVAAADEFWRSVRDQRHAFFAAKEMWRFSVPPAAPALDVAGDWLIEWGGAQRWLRAEQLTMEAAIRAAVDVGGHVSRWRPKFTPHPLEVPIRHLHKRLKTAFDPAGIFNPGALEGC